MSETLQILEKLNSLYSGAFSQLIAYTVGVFSLVGLFVPLSIASFQNRQLRRDHTALSAHIEAEMDAARTLLSEEIGKQLKEAEQRMHELLSETRKDIDAEIKKMDGLAMARSLHLQARSSANEWPGSALYDCFSAIPLYVAAKDERNLRATLGSIELVISRVRSEDFQMHELDKAFGNAIDALKTLNETGRYEEDIDKLRMGMTKAKAFKPAIEVAPA